VTVSGLVVALAAITVLSACGDEPDATPDPAAPPTDPTVIDDVARLAPALESYSRSAGYAATLDEALAKLTEADLFPTEPNVVGSYLYDEAAVEFQLCIESPEGSWATYDTSPMSIFESGASGGCP
jgi:hypothetical protein